MKKTIFAIGLTIGLLAVSTDLHAQFGALRRKAEQAVKSGVDKATSQPKAEKEAPKQASTPETAPETAAQTETAKAPATPAETAKTQPAPAAQPAKPAPQAKPVQAEAKPPKPPLEQALDRIDQYANRLLHDHDFAPQGLLGNWTRPPVYFVHDLVAAARALDEPARVAFTEKALVALKAAVESETFGKAYDEYIRNEEKAVNHGIKAMSAREYEAKGDRAGYAAYQKRGTLANVVQDYDKRKADNIQWLIGEALKDYPERAANWAKSKQPKKQAMYLKMAEDAKALQSETDLTRLRRGIAVLKATEFTEEPITEEALYAIPAIYEKEAQQANWNDHNLKVVLKLDLAAFAALVPTVDFAAATREEKGRTKFVNPAYEKKPEVWKMVFRAGKGPSTAAAEFAKVWLKQL